MQRNSSKPTPTRSTPLRTPETPACGEGIQQAWVAASGKDGTWILRFEDGRLCTAKRAAACLLEPEPGDNVLVFAPASGMNYVLSILEKAGSDNTLSLEGDLALKLHKGAFSVQAEEVSLEAQQNLDLQADTVRLRGIRGLLHFMDTGVHSLRLEIRAKQTLAAFDSVRHTARSLVQHLRDSVRRVDNVETLEAGHLRERIQGLRHSLAENVTSKARRRLKLDGKKIHLG